MNVLLLLISSVRNFVYTSEEGDRIGSPDEISDCSLLEQGVISVFVAISFPTSLLGLEDVGLEIVGG